MLISICVVYFLCAGTPVSCELYKFVLSDQISETGIIEEMSNIANRIHCATACLQQSECKGFGYTNQEKDCLLLDKYMEQDYCSKESCQTRQGMRVYMVRLKTLCKLIENGTTKIIYINKIKSLPFAGISVC